MSENTLIINTETDISSLTFPEDTQTLIKFDSEIDVDSFMEKMHQLYEMEEKFYAENNGVFNIVLFLKNLPTDHLIELYRDALWRETLVNSSVILNINILVNGYNTLDDAMFEAENIFESDLEQLLDLKLELSGDIKEFQTALMRWFLACFKSMYKVELVYLDTYVEIPNIYKRMLLSNHMLTLSQIFAKTNNISTDELPLVKDAYPIIMEVASITAISSNLMKIFDNQQ